MVEKLIFFNQICALEKGKRLNMNITGIMVYYYFICERRLWYFANQINMEQNSELVQIGKIIDETTYKREKKGILIDNTINIDFINNGAVLHEVKKTKSIEEAGIWQLKYYMYYLEQKGIENIVEQDKPPKVIDSKICKKCSYFDLCYV